MMSPRTGGDRVISELDWLVEDLLRVEDVMREAVATSQPLVNDAAMHLIEAGGKRLRPALVLISARAGDHRGRASDLSAAALELVHLATLIHDDVIDETETRRSVPTVHARWGVEIAVLAGDYLFACGCALGAEAGGEVPGVLAAAIAEVCQGQIAETASLGDPHRTIEHYRSTVVLKTAALFRAACELGAATSGAPASERAALASYGSDLGITFQIVDDLLDLVGDPAVTGKRRGSDLREGVFTLPVLLAARRDPAIESALVAPRDVERIVEAVRASGALEEAFNQAQASGRRAVETLAGVQRSPCAETLGEVVDGVLAQVPASALLV